MKTTNDDCVGIRGNNKRFGRGVTHESKQRHLYIYQRAAPSFRIVNATSTEASLASQVYTKYTVLFSLASGQNLHEGSEYNHLVF